MKKVLAGVAAGALLLSVAGVVMARKPDKVVSTVNQNALTVSVTGAVSVSGGNTQNGGGKETMITGDSFSSAKSITAGNVNVGSKGNVNQSALTGSLTVAGGVSGLNTQNGSSSKKHPSSQFMMTGDSGSRAGSITVSNVSVE